MIWNYQKEEKCLSLKKTWIIRKKLFTQTDNPEKINGTKIEKETKQKWKGPKTLDICFSVIFKRFDQSLISGMVTGHEALPPTNFGIFQIFPSFLRS